MGELQHRLVLGLDDLTRDLLLDDGRAPVLIEPWLFDGFLVGVGVQKRVRGSDNIKVNLEVDDVVVQRAH